MTKLLYNSAVQIEHVISASKHTVVIDIKFMQHAVTWPKMNASEVSCAQQQK